MSVGNRIKALRKELGLTQEKFSSIIHVSRSTIGNIEVDTFPIQDRMVCDICREFGVRREWLLDGEGEMFEPIDRDVELAGYVAEILTEDNGSIRKRIIETMRRADKTLSAEHWEALSRLFTIWAEVNRDFDSE